MSNQAQPPVNPFAAQQQLLRERLHLLLSNLHPALQTDVRRAFEERGKLLFQPPNNEEAANPSLPSGSWPLLTLLFAQHFSPQIDPLLAGSVAITTKFSASDCDRLEIG